MSHPQSYPFTEAHVLVPDGPIRDALIANGRAAYVDRGHDLRPVVKWFTPRR